MISANRYWDPWLDDSGRVGTLNQQGCDAVSVESDRWAHTRSSPSAAMKMPRRRNDSGDFRSDNECIPRNSVTNHQSSVKRRFCCVQTGDWPIVAPREVLCERRKRGVDARIPGRLRFCCEHGHDSLVPALRNRDS